MTRIWVVLMTALFVINLASWFTVGGALNLFVAGVMLGVGYMMVIDWWCNRKINREIMAEIALLSRNYDNQMTLFPQNNSKEEAND